jgi:putative chitinase
MDINKLKGVIPDVVISEIPSIIEKFKINSTLRLSHFLAQSAHESSEFKFLNENLNYSAELLNKVFPKYFPTIKDSTPYARQPEKIASKVYGNRMGNGAEITKDGYKFRGRGYIQLTGHDDYKLFGESISVDILSNPDLVATKYPLLSAAWFWSKNGLNEISDLGATEDVVTKITKRVNGGTIGLPDRISHFNKFYNILK